VTSLSTHVLDIERGTPAVGLRISLLRGETVVARALTDDNGRIPDLGGGSLDPGTYQLVFEVAEYLRGQGRQTPFLQRVSLDFRIEPEHAHYHIPLLMSAYACTAYRGS